MANVGSPARGNYPDRTSNVGAIKDVFVKFGVGASPSTITQKTLGEIISITNTGTGAYTVQLSQSYYQNLGVIGEVAQATYSASGACKVVHISDSNEAANGTFKILLVTAAGAAVDASSGDVVHIDCIVQIDSIIS